MTSDIRSSCYTIEQQVTAEYISSASTRADDADIDCSSKKKLLNDSTFSIITCVRTIMKQTFARVCPLNIVYTPCGERWGGAIQALCSSSWQLDTSAVV